MAFIPTKYAYPQSRRKLNKPLPGESDFWASTRDNISPWMQPDLNPDIAPIRAQYGYEVKEYYRSPSGDVVVFPGAQGQVTAVPGPGVGKPGYCIIHLTEQKVERVVPLSILRGGNRHLNDRKLNMSAFFVQGMPNIQTGPAVGDQLGKAIHAWLVSLTASDLAHLTDEYIESAFGGPDAMKIPTYVNRIHKGVQEAGLLDVLNDPTFTIHDIMHHATPITAYADKEGGIYIRVSKHKVTGDIEIYIGRSGFFGQRHNTYKTEVEDLSDPRPRPHIQACRDAEWVRMYRLCVLSDLGTNTLSLVEQAFVCLLGSYTLNLMNQTPEAIAADMMRRGFAADNTDNTAAVIIDRRLDHRINAAQFIAITRNAATVSHWPGGTTRATFGAIGGTNVDSPLMEVFRGQSIDRMLYFRRDTVVPNKDPNAAPIPVAVFRRSIPTTVKYSKLAKGWKFGGIHSAFCRRGRRKGQQVSTFANKIFAQKPDGTEYPAEGSKMWLSFEIRKDGGPVATPYLRLPTIGPFADWSRPLSLAVKIEWRDAKNVWRMNYLQKDHTDRFWDANVSTGRGSVPNYAVGTALIRWLLRETPDKYTLGRHWTFDFSPIYVLQIETDYLRQEISLKEPPRLPAPLTSARVDYATQRTAMSSLPIGRTGCNPRQRRLQDTTLTLPQGLHMKAQDLDEQSCDTCFVMSIGKNIKGFCVHVPGTQLCKNCDLLGRPYCTYTLLHDYASASSAKAVQQAGAAIGHAAAIQRVRTEIQKGLWVLQTVHYRGNNIQFGFDPTFMRIGVEEEEGDDSIGET
jgi:hypothetical protein